jgi:hypothetical protein
MPLPGNMRVESSTGESLNADLKKSPAGQVVVVRMPPPTVVEKVVEKVVEVKPEYNEAELKKMTKKDIIKMLVE